MIDLMQTQLDKKSVKHIAKNYNPLGYKGDLIQLLLSACPTANFCGWEKKQLHILVNDLLMNNYNGEQVLKYQLFQIFKKKNLIAAFEIKVKNSRADFLTINGCTNSFEIKSSLDNLCKLKKQALDYVLAFEYNYLVIDETHLEKAVELVPKCFGLWSFKNGRKKIHREATLNENIDAEVQLSLLTKKDLLFFFNEVNGDKNQILRSFHHDEINYRFKSALKEKYRGRWSFLVENVHSILPVDLQFFFKTNINPNYIYHS